MEYDEHLHQNIKIHTTNRRRRITITKNINKNYNHYDKNTHSNKYKNFRKF